MARCKRLIQAIDTFTDVTGRALAWLLAAMALITFLVVVLRYGFEIGSIAGQESVTYLHASVFMLGAAYALKSDAHVRVDIFYSRFRPLTRAWINALGCILFLLPLCAVIFFSSFDLVEQTWSVREVSGDSGGIPAVFLLKSLIPLMALNLALQAIAELLRNAVMLQEAATD